MKKIIIAILVIVVVVVAYVLFASDKENIKEDPVANGVEEPSFGFPVYLGAELIMQDIDDFVTTDYYAVDASLAEVAEFYVQEFPGFETEEDPVFGYGLYDLDTLNSMFVLDSEEEFMDWVEQNKGLVIGISIFSYDLTMDDSHVYMLEDHEEELKGKTVIVATYL